MDTKALIHQEIEKLDQEDLSELYRLVRGFTRTRQSGRKTGFLARLKQIQIDAPEDFATNLDDDLILLRYDSE